MEKIVNNNVELIGWCWFNGRDTIGVVLGYDTITKQKKSYIGKVDGDNERHDLFNILCWGTKFDVECAEKLINQQGFKI
jgi:hypothetical protein